MSAMTPDEIADAKKRASAPTRSEWLALIAALEKAQGQVTALRAAANLAVPNHPKHPALNLALADTEAAALEHDEALREQAFEEAAKDAREIANIPDHMGDIQYRNGALMVAKALDDKAAALVRAELKRGGR